MKKDNVCFWQHYNAEEQADAIQGFAAMLYEMYTEILTEKKPCF